jgi:hypothetical protein
MRIQAVKPNLIKVSIFLLISALTQIHCLSYEQQFSRLSQRHEGRPVRLRLQTKRTTYRVDEPIEFNVYLENVSNDRSYYVGRDIDGISNLTLEFHAIRLTMIDGRGRRVRLLQGASVSDEQIVFVNGKPAPSRSPTVAEILAKEYVILAPGVFYGFRHEILEAYENGRYRNLRAGRYRIQATYQETEALSWPESERESQKVLVWEQPLASNVVEVNVVAK